MTVQRENQRIRLTKMLLKEELIRLMHEKPVNKISVKELCEACELNRSTFYQHYADQYALLEDIEADVIRQTDEYIQKMLTPDGSVQYIAALLTYIRQNQETFRILLGRNSDITLQKRFLRPIMERLQARQFAAYPSDYASYVSSYLLMGSLSFIQQWLENGFDLTVREAADAILRIAVGVVRSLEAGHMAGKV